jgi:hypothetical protein
MAAIIRLGPNFVPRAALKPRTYEPKKTAIAKIADIPVKVDVPVCDDRLPSASTATTANTQERTTALKDSVIVGECPDITLVEIFTTPTTNSMDVIVIATVLIGAINAKNIIAVISRSCSMVASND